MNTRFLRLFPLESVVLLPGALLPLVVFEQRYLQLTQECLDSNEPFGIVLLRQGREAGDSESVPYSIGTTAKIEEVQNGKSGKLHIQVRGMERFEIKELNNTTPYLSAEVEILEDSKNVDSQAKLTIETKNLAENVLKALISRSGGWVKDFLMPDDPNQLSFLIAQMFQGDLNEQQSLLELNSTEDRLTRESKLLKRILKEVINEKGDKINKNKFSLN